MKEFGNGFQVDEPEPEIVPDAPLPVVPAVDTYSDVAYLYNHVLLGYPDSEVAVGTIFDSKHFVKEWPFTDQDDELLRCICSVMPSVSDLGLELTGRFQTGEYIVLWFHCMLKWVEGSSAECYERD